MFCVLFFQGGGHWNCQLEKWYNEIGLSAACLYGDRGSSSSDISVGTENLSLSCQRTVAKHLPRYFRERPHSACIPSTYAQPQTVHMESWISYRLCWKSRIKEKIKSAHTHSPSQGGISSDAHEQKVHRRVGQMIERERGREGGEKNGLSFPQIGDCVWAKPS